MKNIFKTIISILFVSCILQAKADPRSDSFDVQHYAIHLDISDIPSRSIAGFAEIKIQSKKNNLRSLILELWKLNVDSVLQNGKLLPFSYNDSIIIVNLNAGIQNTDTFSIHIYYNGKPKMDPLGWGGFYFGDLHGGYAFNLGVSFGLEPHNFGRAWFPCVDNFIDRATFTVAIRTAAEHKAFCGGTLTSTTTLPDGDMLYIWQLNQSIPPYLASVAVADYETWQKTIQGKQRQIPAIWGMWAIDSAHTKNAFQHIDHGVHAFENSYGPYQFDRVGYVLVPFNSGAMEHAANTTYPRYSVAQGLASEGLWSHELAHSWWGNLVTCRTAEDMWLNEGWATYSEKIFFEYMYGKEAYRNDVLKNHTFVLRWAHLYDDGHRPISPMPHQYTYGRHVYNKGADVAHTLRAYLGDSLFFKGIQAFLQHHAFSDISTDDLKNFLSNFSGKDLTHFFNNFVYSEGFTHFSLKDYKVEPDGNQYRISGKVFQRLKAAPQFYTNVPIEITLKSFAGNNYVETITASGQETSFNFLCNFKPDFAALDLEAKISDAITNQYRSIKTTGKYNFIDSLFNLDVFAIQDSAFVHIEQHWVSAEISDTTGQYTVSPDRYFTVDGLWPEGFQTAANLQYDGRNFSNFAGGWLDTALFNRFSSGNYNEENLLLMYRPSADFAWEVDWHHTRIMGNRIDKRGSFIIHNLRKGHYTFALSETAGIKNIENPSNFVKLYPNPTRKLLNVELQEKLQFISYAIIDTNGKTIQQQLINQHNNKLQIKLDKPAAGTYILLLNTEKGQLSKRFVVE